MKKLIYKFVIIFIIFTSQFSFSQTGWIWQNPLPHGNNVNVVKFLNVNTGWYFSGVGNNYKTTNAGSNWIQEILPSSKEIYSARFYKFDSLFYTCWLGGDSGILLKSTNSGNNWFIIYSPINSVITDVYFLNPYTGYIAASNLYKTTNAGNSWITCLSYLDTFIRSIFFLNDSVGWVARDNSFIQSFHNPYSFYEVNKTTNYGNNWNQVYFNIVLGNYSHILNIFFKDENNGIAKFDFLYKSSNSGSSWSYISDNSFFDFINTSTGFATGNNKFYCTTNFGNNWLITDSLFISKIRQNCIESINANITYVGGLYGDLLKTNDGGYNWSYINKSVTRNNISQIIAADSLNVFALAPNKAFLKTTNSGCNWFSADSLIWNLKSLFFLNKDLGWIGCDNGRIYKTTNGGGNWSLFDLPTSDYIKSIKFFTSGTGYLLDSIGKIYKSSNFGNNWTNIFQFNVNIINFSFPEQFTGYAFKTNIIYKTSNAGINWVSIYTSAGNVSNKNLKFYNTTKGCIIQSVSIPTPPYTTYRTLFTTNGGNNWSEVYNIITSDIHFVDQNIYYGSDNNGNICYTINGGLNWFNQKIANSRINSITTYKKDIWVAGDNGIILKGNQLVPIGIRQINEIIPSSFSLSQNYPNPFNPTTTISYKVKSYQVIKLVVYDILGKEVSVLVNEKQSPGTYEVQFPDAMQQGQANVQLPSGIYFYTLYADGERIDTKKMVLLK